MIRVLLADDQRVVREGLGTLLGLLDGIELVGTAADGEEAVALAAEHDPDVVLMDLRMPRVDGIEAIRRLAARGERPRAIALTTYADDASVLGALRAGARGYLTKDAGAEEIRAAVEAVARGEAALDPAVQHHVVAALSAPARRRPGAGPAELPDGLTPREAEVLALIAEGLTNTEIADRLVVSAATVKSHVNHIFAKTASATARRPSSTPTSTASRSRARPPDNGAGRRVPQPGRVDRRARRQRQLGRQRAGAGVQPDARRADVLLLAAAGGGDDVRAVTRRPHGSDSVRVRYDSAGARIASEGPDEVASTRSRPFCLAA